MAISVCMATCNGSMFIKSQLESILIQLSESDELIIVDDVSDDDTIEIIRSFNDSRIKLFCNARRVGVTRNFNISLSKASGDYIFLCDQDDVWLEDRVSSSMDLLKKHDIVVSNCKVTDQFGHVIFNSYFDVVNSGPGLLKNMFKCTYLGCSLSFRRTVLQTVLPIPENLIMFHDWWIGIISEIKFHTYFDPIPRFFYRRHNNATSPTLGLSNRSLFSKFFSRIQIYILAVNRCFRR